MISKSIIKYLILFFEKSSAFIKNKLNSKLKKNKFKHLFNYVFSDHYSNPVADNLIIKNSVQKSFFKYYNSSNLNNSRLFQVNSDEYKKLLVKSLSKRSSKKKNDSDLLTVTNLKSVGDDNQKKPIKMSNDNLIKLALIKKKNFDSSDNNKKNFSSNFKSKELPPWLRSGRILDNYENDFKYSERSRLTLAYKNKKSSKADLHIKKKKIKKKTKWRAADFGNSPYLLAQEKGLEKMKELAEWRKARGWLARRRRFYFYRKSMKEWRSLNFLRLNYFNKPFLLKSNWDNRKAWNQVYFFRYASRYLYFKNKATIRVYFLRYLAKRKNSQLKSFLRKLSYKRQKLLFFFNSHEARLDNFILNWGYLKNLTISKSRFLIKNGFVYVNFLPKVFYTYSIKKNDCVTLSYYGLSRHKTYYHTTNIGSTKWHKSLVEYRHFSKVRRRKFIKHNNLRIVYGLVRYLKFSHWNKRYFNFFFRFFESSPIVKAFVYFYFYSWFAYKFSKFLNYLLFSKRINSIFLNTRLF